jgi:hypothetical protein
MTQDHNQRRVQDTHGVLKAGYHFIARDIAGDSADKDVASRSIEAVLRSDAGIRAAKNGGKRILPNAESFAFMLEVMPSADAINVAHIAFHQPVKRVVGR